MFIIYPYPIEESMDLALSMRDFNETGFYPGIYDYAEDADRGMDHIEKQGKTISQFVFEFYRDNVDMFSVPSTPKRKIPVQR